MRTSGRHMLVEYRGCDPVLLNDKVRIEKLMRHAVEVAQATAVGAIFRTFSPQGVSGVVVVEESHLSIHTWPEHGYAAVDFYTCGDCTPEEAHTTLKRGLGATSSEVMTLQRGEEPSGPSIQVVRHHAEEAGVEHPVDSRHVPALEGIS